jgi:N-acetyl-anhydromuramyl-L-alanine amidase AmpD
MPPSICLDALLVFAITCGCHHETSNPALPLKDRPSDVIGAAYAPFVAAATTTHRPIAAGLMRPVRFIVIHTMENTFPNIVEYFRRPGTPVASHYLIRAHDGWTLQMVDERAVAFHDACFNDESIGIEHEGYVVEGARWYGDALYASSARLVADVARRHGIPLDRQHILGHSETPDCSDHTDPGPDWDWDRFMTELHRIAP